MPNTPEYGIYYDTEDDLALGQVQARKMASSIEDAFAAIVAAIPATLIGDGRPDITSSVPAELRQKIADAPNGTRYSSTSGQAGAWGWQKRNGKWVVTDGDTGWREMPIPDAMREVLTDTSGSSTREHFVQLRRQGDTIHARGWFRLDGATWSDDGSTNRLCRVPAGFQDSRNPTSGYFAYSGSLGYYTYTPARGGGGIQYTPWAQNLTLNMGDSFADSAWKVGVGFTMSWPASDAWPSSLPGTAA